MKDFFKIWFRNVIELFAEPDYGLFAFIKRIFLCILHLIVSIVSIVLFPIFYFIFNDKEVLRNE